MEPPESKSRHRLRMLVCLAALPLGLLVTDWMVGKYYLDSADGAAPPVPPFDVLSSPHLAPWLEEQRESLTANASGRSLKSSFDAELGWTRTPGRSGRINRVGPLGTRGDRDYTPAVPADVVRLSGFGDSFIFGSEVKDHETWGAILEGLHPSLEFLNFGVAGYGLDQALLRYRRKRATVRSDIVVVDVHVDSILRLVTRCRAWQQPQATQIHVKPRFRLVDDQLVLLPQPFRDQREMLECALAGDLEVRLGEFDNWVGEEPLIPGSALAKLLAAHRAQERRDYVRLWQDTDGEAFQLMRAILLEFRKEALEDGAKEFVVLLFSKYQDHSVRDPERGVPFLDPLREWLQEEQFQVVDMDRRLADAMDPKLTSREQVFRQAHFSPGGNKLVAGELLEWLCTESQLAPRIRGASGQ